MIVQVQTRHFAAATCYTDTVGCPMYHALKEIFPDKVIEVGGYTVDIGNHTYRFNPAWHNSKRSITDVVRKLISEAKAGEETPTFDVNIIGL